MRKIAFVLAAFLMAAPAFAAVDVTITATPGDANATVSFTNDEAQGKVRAFALELSVDAGTIKAVECLAAGYYVYPGSIEIDGGTVTDWGTCVASGIDSNLVIIEMGSLYAAADPMHPTAPDQYGPLLKVTVSGNCNLCVGENALRGGVVMEDPAEPPTTNLPRCEPVTPDVLCYAGQPDVAQWDLVGQPECWCYARQCLGDADGLPYGKNNYWVAILDLAILKSAWNKPKEQLVGNEICADFDHQPYGKNDYRVAILDLAILKANWNITNGPAGTCQPGNRAP
ncbi:MAG TPA: hypothetical protein VMW16_16705 [Sedimentisphaerales bacterium]|nr:hypothetical protein [Sedimentisphaerales bacterium]